MLSVVIPAYYEEETVPAAAQNASPSIPAATRALKTAVRAALEL